MRDVRAISSIDERTELAADAESDGHRFVTRMVEEWRDGTNRFDRPGEDLWGVWLRGELVAVGGLNVDPYVSDARVGRVRHFYVAQAERRSGHGSVLLDRVIDQASRSFDLLRLRTFNPDAAAFYVARGFSDVSEDEFCTHQLQLSDRDMVSGTMDFVGVKVALLLDDQILVYLRDDDPEILYPGAWDLPGGGREGSETPFECAAREVFEEFGIVLGREAVLWSKTWPSAHTPDAHAVFMVAAVSQPEVDAVRFGDEGQEWWLMPVTEFLHHDRAPEHFKERLRDYIVQVQRHLHE